MLGGLLPLLGLIFLEQDVLETFMLGPNVDLWLAVDLWVSKVLRKGHTD